MPKKSGMKIDDGVYRKMRRRVEELDTRTLKIGVLSSKGGSAPHDKSGITIVELAAVHEFGSPAANIPERSFIRRTFEKKDRQTKKFFDRLAAAVIKGKIDADQALNLLGSWGASEVKKTMVEGIPPPLAPSTLAKRKKVQAGVAGKDTPLIDTGRLLDSIQWEVE